MTEPIVQFPPTLIVEAFIMNVPLVITTSLATVTEYPAVLNVPEGAAVKFWLPIGSGTTPALR